MIGKAAIVAAAFAAALMFAPHAVRCAEREPAPDFSCPVWLNSKPLRLSDLRGKVVLVDFWEYTCINCIRTFPYLRRWNQLYAPLGLVIIGVHTPEFDFAKNPELVKNAAHRFGLNFPIAVDSERTAWAAFHNDAWPADYLIDRDGNVAFVHFGEGEYAEMEQRIQALLREADPKLDFAAAKFRIPADKPMFGGVCRVSTPELYIGAERDDRIANEGGIAAMTAKRYSSPVNIPTDYFSLDGAWFAAPEYVKLAPTPGGSAQGSLILHYRSKALYLVAGSTDGASSRLWIEQDGKPLAPDARGVDVKTNSAGNTYIELGAKRMYYLVNNPQFGEHRLTLTATSVDTALYSFTFGNNCETPFAHK
jgi:thiol-disulfide isomerase/thioredoxin